MLPKTFYERDTLTVSQELLGKILCFNNITAQIIETEGYRGEDDPACHAARGMTPRTKTMYGPAGTAYIYLIYGMYYCLNIVTENEGFPAAVLIRGVIQQTPVPYLLDGPGKLCRALGINKAYNGCDMTLNQSFCVIDIGHTAKFVSTPRIGISKGQDKLWRYLAI
ncbi:DNA-3-methyladenine glycosylase [Candidatus Tisiphia endosymbiont of Nemotelus uliginosus]|uniref:DNA-3-methyladenine glycosylase n=1 Tax=Candidatus Tisiphia endosymbiont of Nemotelus uliginosus TaxID=3077926 RepID=UPI0035C8B05A